MTYVFVFDAVLRAWPRLLEGAIYTIQLSVISIALGFVLGTLCAIVRHQNLRILNPLVSVYVDVIRNTPFLVQAFLVFFGLSTAGIQLSAQTAAILAITLNVGAYSCEIMRAGLESIHRSQIEAAESLGMSKSAIYWHVILLPATERVYPALTSQFILMMLATSVTSQISAEELTGIANIIQSETFRSFETYIVVGVIYIGLSLLFRLGFWLIGQVLFRRKRLLGTSV
ncbi:amino acid ABC transporter permease [Rhodobacter sp. 24-YEA-8]|uniref:amino acid ABC transporter permease n=1 Tax=Rhodobacter sp. 24-YEA-8 TaxID=1884310 RepID=UPI000B84EC8A|nr:amino acid ABC transporter permease [Rhodobacter sp. 24-YEA-8]